MLRTHLAVIFGNLVYYLSRLLGQGGGTAAPGYYALKIQPDLLNFFNSQLKKGTIVVSGTNGKTTTSRLISHYFSQKNISYLHNRQGSNLERGLVSESLNSANILGKLPPTDYALWELDEAVFSKKLEIIKPSHVLILNLFRDQLDRYGEVDAIRQNWYLALSKLESVSIIYNSDDPQIFYLIEQLKQQKSNRKYTSYSVHDNQPNYMTNTTELLSPIELVICPKCKSRLTIQKQTIVGQGIFECTTCGLSNSISDIKADVISLDKSNTSFKVLPDNVEISTDLNGIYNIYNITAAASLLKNLNFSIKDFSEKNLGFKTAFGRMERIKIKNKELLLCLIKNPTGFSETLKTLHQSNLISDSCGLILNDRFADGKDVSWIWDVPLHAYFNSQSVTVYLAGDRAYDLALRCKYAGLASDKIIICENIREMIEKITATNSQSITPVCATYTASLELQNLFQKEGVKKVYWKE
jgi:UDP-N-acetylmuramyl tripeptide synthase